jgi:hypothetical protein
MLLVSNKTKIFIAMEETSMKQTKWRQAAVLLLLMTATVSAAGAESNTAGPASGAAESYQIEAVAGRSYEHVKWFFILPVKLTPQIAVWVEDAEGRILTTIYVTRKAAEASWSGGAEERPGALPIYSHRLTDSEADVISGATPRAGKERSLGWEARLTPGRSYTFYVEVNASFDYNERYTRENSGVNGQPSLLYAAHLSAGGSDRAVEFQLVGHGAVDGSSGAAYSDTEGITDARQILKHLRLVHSSG